MGCTSSKPQVARSTRTAALAAHRNKDEALLKSDVSADELHKMKEDIMQRHDTEIDVLSQIASERQALRSIAGVRIARRLSCEDLMETMKPEDFSRLQDPKFYRYLQKQFRSEKVKESLVRKSKLWVVSDDYYHY